MRFHSTLVLGLSFLSAFAAAEAPATGNDAIVVDKRDLSSGLLVHARDATVGVVHEVEERALHGRSPRKNKVTTKAAEKTTAKQVTKTTQSKTTQSKTTQSKTSVTPTSTSAETTSSVSKTSSQKTSSTVVSTSSHLSTSSKTTLSSTSSASTTSSQKTSSTVVSSSSGVSSSTKSTLSTTATATDTDTETSSTVVSTSSQVSSSGKVTVSTTATATSTNTDADTATSFTVVSTSSQVSSSGAATVSTTATASGTDTETSATVISTSSSSASSGEITSTTLGTTTTTTATGTGTETSTSASSTSTIKARVRCGEKGSTCSGDSCSLARSIDFRQTINRRAYGNADGQIRNLINRKGNVKLSNQALRDSWIDFGTDAASVTIGGLTGCTAVIAISEKGMYAFHIWEAGEGDTLEPAKYAATLAQVSTKLASKQAELAGGQLYVYLPNNPDQAGKLLYDSTHWNDDLTEEQSEPVKAGDTKWIKQVKRVDAIKTAITQGSGLQITRQTTYNAPLKGVKTSDWMTAQFDPAASDSERQSGVWTSEDGQIAQTKWSVSSS